MPLLCICGWRNRLEPRLTLMVWLQVFGVEYEMDALSMRLFNSTGVKVRRHQLVPHHLGLYDAGRLDQNMYVGKDDDLVSPLMSPAKPSISPAKHV